MSKSNNLPPAPKQPTKKKSAHKEPLLSETTKSDPADYTTDLIFISKAGQLGLDAHAIYLSGYIENNSISTAYDGIIAGVTVQYGIESYLNLYLTQNYSNYTLTSNSNPEFISSNKGVGDTTLGSKGSLYLNPGFLLSYDTFYRGPILAKSDRDDSKTNESTSNGVSERGTIRATGHFAILLGDLSFGLNATGETYQEGAANVTLTSGTRTTTYSSGTGSYFLIYGQYDFGAKIGASYAMINLDPYDSTSNGITTRNSGSKRDVFRVYGLLKIDQFEFGGGLSKLNIKNTTIPLTSNVYFTDAFVRVNF